MTKREKLLIPLAVVLVIYGFLTLINIGFLGWWRRTVPEPISVFEAEVKEDVFIAETEASPQSIVQDKLVAEKLDLERKVIRVSDQASAQEVAALAEQYGAEIISQSDEFVVAKVPKEQTELVEEELKQTQAAESLEVDHPTFLAAESYDWGVRRIEAPLVWDTTSAEGIRVAVIDTGLDYSHPDLSARYAGGYDTFNQDDDPFDGHGHGTHVSGIIAADLNDVGQAGVSPKASLVAVKALGDDGTGYISDLVEAIDWAMNNGVTIINFSLGTSYDSLILEDKLQEAADQGILLVAAAGNTNGGSVLYPAAYDTVISVSATDSSDNLASFSSVGAELSAPGVSISSTVPGGGYASWSGTSMAAPHVTATAALMIANDQENIRESLRNTAVDLGPSGKDSYFGYGLVHSKPAALGEDVLSPVVTIIEPEHEAEVAEEVRIEVNVQDESQLQEVKLIINNQERQIWSTEISENLSFEWDTAESEPGEYQIVVQATDEYDNLGQAKVEVDVVAETEISPTASPSAVPTWYDRGESLQHRQDIFQEQAMEKRQNEEHAQAVPHGQDESNTNRPTQAVSKTPEEREEKGEKKEEVPTTTNSNQRNPRPNPSAIRTESVSNKSQGQGKTDNPGKAKGKVKGVKSRSWWRQMLHLLKF